MRGVVFDVLQQHRIAELRREFIRIENVEQHHFVAAIAQRLDHLDDLLRLFVKIRHHDHDAAPLQKLLKMMNGLEKSVREPPSAFSMACRMRISWPCRVDGRDVVGHVLIEDDQAGGVALLRRQIGQRCGEEARIIEFADLARAIRHRRAGIEQNQQLHVRLALEPLQIETLGAGEDVPVDVAQIVALHVLLIFGELLAETELRRTVQSRDEPVHYRLRDEVERRNGSEYCGIEKLLQHFSATG